MILNKLLSDIQYSVLQGSDNIDIDTICWDSRRVEKNSLFICVKNKNADRHDHALEAIEKGAKVLLVEHEIKNIPKHVVVVKTENSKKSMAVIANKFYNEPSKKFNLIGITGTNGKTSVSYFVQKILETSGRKVGIIGTIQNCIGDKPIQAKKLNPTTPDSIELQQAFSEMAEEKVTDVVMEVTSSALSEHRVDMCDFDSGIFTNFTQDHLEEHETMDNYKKAKMKLFSMCKFGVVNIDDPIGNEIINIASCSILTYSINNNAYCMAKNINYFPNSTRFTLNIKGNEKEVNLKIPGKFSIYNALAAAVVCFLNGLTIDEIACGLDHVEGVKGRFQSVPNTKGLSVIVDYAHSPDSLNNVLYTAKEFTKGKLITVFGCGGDRDKSKRPIMGRIAGKLSDYCILTSDNPRNEDSISIISDIEKGIKETPCAFEVKENRHDAIFAALKYAKQGDTIIIAGKGHEAYQIYGEHILHFDDVEVVNKALQNNDWRNKNE